MTYHFMPTRKTKKKKKVKRKTETIPNSGEDAEKLNHLYIIVGNTKWYR